MQPFAFELSTVLAWRSAASTVAPKKRLRKTEPSAEAPASADASRCCLRRCWQRFIADPNVTGNESLQEDVNLTNETYGMTSSRRTPIPLNDGGNRAPVDVRAVSALSVQVS